MTERQVVDIRVSTGRVEEYRNMIAEIRKRVRESGATDFVIRVSDGETGVDVLVRE